MLSKKERKENAKVLAMLRKKEIERKQLTQRFNLTGDVKTSWERFSNNSLIKKGHFDYHLNK